MISNELTNSFSTVASELADYYLTRNIIFIPSNIASAVLLDYIPLAAPCLTAAVISKLIANALGLSPRQHLLGMTIYLNFAITPLRALSHRFHKLISPGADEALDRIQKESQGTKNMLLLHSDDIPFCWTHVVRIRDLAKTYLFDRFIISDKNDYISALQGGKKYDRIYLSGHGNPDNMGFGSYYLHTEELSGIESLCNALKPGGELVFNSCNIGRGEENLAWLFSSMCRSATIYASASYHNGALFSYEIDKTDTPILRAWDGSPSTRIYKNGTLLENPTHQSANAEATQASTEAPSK